MSEQDDDMPPEVDITVEQFKFHEITQLEVAKFAEKPRWNFIRTSALAVANKFGAVFVGIPTGIKVLSSSSLLQSKAGQDSTSHEIANISLRKQPTWIAVSSDNLTISVCCCSDEGIQCLYFDIRNIFNKAKAIKTPFYQNFLSKSKDVAITSLVWNPSEDFADLLALSLSNGKLYVLSVKDGSPSIRKEDDSMNACAVSWNTDGKHLLIGKGDGSLCQLSQNTFDVEHSVSVANVIAGDVRTCDLLWISDCDIAPVFTQSGDDDTPKLVLAKLEAKNVFSNIAWKDYDEPSSGFNESRPTQLYLELIKEWDFFLYVSSNSANVTILAKNKDTGVWEIWNIYDTCRAVLPLSKYTDEDSAAIGVSVLTGHGNSHPVLAVLTDDCVLCVFEMVNNMKDYSNIVHKVCAVDLKEERVATKQQDAAKSLSANQPPAFQKQKLTARQSILPSTKPLFASQGFTQVPASTLSKVTPLTKLPVSASMARSSPVIPKVNEAQPPPKAPMQSKAIFPGTSPTVLGKSKPDSRIISTSIQEPRKSKIPSLLKSKSRQPDVKSTMREISDFEEELEQFQSLCEEKRQIVDTIVKNGSKKPPELQTLAQFKQDIHSTTFDHGLEIEDLSTELLTLLSEAKQVTQKRILKSDGFYKEMMYNRPLSQSQRQKYSELQNLYRYVVNSSQEANTLLDHMWQNDGAGSALKKGKRGKTREWEAARQALVSNMKVFHDLQVQILCLGQQIDRMRISSRIAPSESVSGLSPRPKQLPGGVFQSPALKGDRDSLKVKESALNKTAATENKLSAIKQHKLAKVLAQRDNKRVIRADLSRTSILRTSQKLKETPAASESDAVDYSTTSPSTGTEDDEYSGTEESSEVTESPLGSISTSQLRSTSIMPQGSATLAYGAPNLGSFHRPIGKPFSLAANAESKMNLNHPPQVVNIQNVSKPISKSHSLFQSFQPKPEVPAGAVEVVQSVLETVKAEKKQPVPQDWKFMYQEKEDGAGGDVAEKAPEPVTSSAFLKPQPKITSSMFQLTGRETSTTPPVYPFSTPLSTKTPISEEVSFFKAQSKGPLTADLPVSKNSIFNLQAPSTKSPFNNPATSSKPTGGTLFSGAPLFSSTPAVTSESIGLPRLSLERRGLFTAASPVPTTVSATVVSNPSSNPSSPSTPPFSIEPKPVPLTTTPQPVKSQSPQAVKPPTPQPEALPTPQPMTSQTAQPVTSQTPQTISSQTPQPVKLPSPQPTKSPVAQPVKSPAPESLPTAESPSDLTPAASPDPTSISNANPPVAATELPQADQTGTQDNGSAPPPPEYPQTAASNAPALPLQPPTTSSLPVTTANLPSPPVVESSSVVTPVQTPSEGLFSVKPSLSQPTIATEVSQSTSVFGAETSNTGFPAASGSFGGFSSLSFGEKPAATGAPKNPFQSPFGGNAPSSEASSEPSIFGQTSQTFGTKSVFGASNQTSQDPAQSHPFGQAATQAQSPFASFASPTNGSVVSQGFGGFNKASGNAFGAPAKFGSTAVFGSSPAFGNTSRTFGSGFGSNNATQENKGFGLFASSDDNSNGFGALASQSSGGVFGNFGGQGASTFGNVANQSNSTGFEAFANQGNSNQGGSVFGSATNQNTSNGFGSLAAQGSTNVFGGGQGNSTGFGAMSGNQGTPSAFGGQTGNQGSGNAFGESGNQATSFGAFGNPSPSFGSFGGGMQANQTGSSFGMQSGQPSSFSGWR